METTQIYTHVHIEALREIHARTHPHGRLNETKDMYGLLPTAEIPEHDLPSPPAENKLQSEAMWVAAAPGPEVSAAQAGISNGSCPEPPDEEPPAGGSPCAKPKPPPTGGPSSAKSLLALQNPAQKSTEFQRFRPGVAYYGYRWYDPSTGRWASRDPIEEEGGANLYGFVDNDGLNSTDYLGLDFIAAGSRPLKPPLGILGGEGWPANHASLEYFTESVEPGQKLNAEFTTAPAGAINTQSIELLQYPDRRDQKPYGWTKKGWRDGNGGKRREHFREIITVGISGISYENSDAKRFIVVKPCAKKRDWSELLENAKNYSYAEDFESLKRGAALSRPWPNSKYEFPPNGNNSNSFVRFMLKQADIAIPGQFLNTFEHPGAYFPSPHSDPRPVAPTYNPHWQ